MIDNPMSLIIAALAPVFFEFAFAVDEVFFVTIFINEMIGVKEAVTAHGWDKNKL